MDAGATSGTVGASGAAEAAGTVGMEGAAAWVIAVVAATTIAQVAAVSAEDTDIGEMIAEAMEKVGMDGVITVDESGSRDTTLNVKEGMLKVGFVFLMMLMVFVLYNDIVRRITPGLFLP